MREVWKWLNGKKRDIAGLWWLFCVPAVAIIWPDGAPDWAVKSVSLVGLFLSSIGYGHAVFKGELLKGRNAPTSQRGL